MASPIGDTIDLLSTTTPLTAGSTWSSSGVVLGQYNSLVVMIKTDVDSTLFVDWSGDNGINWDASDSHPIVDTVTKRVVITTQQKMMRLRLLNGTLNQTYLRLFTYGVVTNNSSLVSLVSSIDIANLISGLSGKQTQVTQLTPINQYNFAVGNISSGVTNGNGIGSRVIYNDLLSTANNNNSTVGMANGNNGIGGYIYLLPSNIALSAGQIWSRSHSLRAGETLISRTVASFGTSDTTAGTSLIGLFPPPLSDAINTTVLPTYFGLAFGWYITGVKTNNNFGIVYANGQVVRRPNFNGDKCDGNSTLPELDFTDPTKPNLFQIEVTAGGNLRFSIMNPSDNKFVIVHQVTNLHNEISNIIPELCFSMYADQGTGHTTGTDELRVLSASLLTDLPIPFPTSITNTYTFDIVTSGGVIYPFAMRNTISYATTSNFQYAVYLKAISISTSGTNPVTVSLLSGNTSSYTGGSWALSGTLSNSIPIQINTSGSTSFAGNSVYTFNTFNLGANDSLYQTFDSLLPLFNSYRPIIGMVNSVGTSDVRISFTLAC